MKEIVESLLLSIGEDPDREGLKETPDRFSKSFKFLCGGYKIDPLSVIKTFSSETYDQMILLKNIELYSLCEHHLLPFFGKAHIAYIPNGKVIGVSKLARLLDIFSRRLQIQERIGEQVTTSLMEGLNAIGAACIIEADHLCMRMRGVEKQNSIMVTSSLKGVFIQSSTMGIAAREELTRLIR
jgi:GTP cyclohydrolase I